MLRAVGQPEAAKIIGWAGRLGEEKNWRLFLQLAASLGAARGDVAFWLAGGGESHGGGDRLREAVREYQLEERLRWFRVLEYDEMPRFYQAIAASGGVFTLTSREESFGMVLLEAMAAGAPVVATRVGGVPEVVEDGVTGKLVPSEDLAALQAAVTELLDRPAERQRLIAAAQSHVAAHYGRAGLGERHAALYRRVLARPAEPCVVLLTRPGWDSTGGGQRPRKLAEALSALGHRVAFVQHFEGEESTWENVYIVATPEKDWRDLSFDAVTPAHLQEVARQMRRLFPRHRPTVVINCTYTLLSLLQMRALQQRGAVAVYDCLDDWEAYAETDPAMGYDPAVERALAQEAEVLSSSSQHLRARLEALAGGPGVKPVVLAPNGLDAAYARRPREERPADLPAAAFLVGYVGSLWGGWHDWDLVQRLAARRPDWTFVLIGPPDPAVQRRFAASENVHLLGLKPHAELHRYVDQFQVGIIPFQVTRLIEPIRPLKIYDYLGRGIPVVSSPLPELRDFPSVWLARSDDEWEQALEEAAATPVDRAALEEFLAGHTWERSVTAILEAAERQRRKT
jgi:glycosyltransferase involved in cell wall biosynthesis